MNMNNLITRSLNSNVKKLDNNIILRVIGVSIGQHQNRCYQYETFLVKK